MSEDGKHAAALDAVAEEAATMDALVEEALRQKCESLEQKLKDIKKGIKVRMQEDDVATSMSVGYWNMEKTTYEEEMEKLKRLVESQKESMKESEEANAELVAHKKDMKRRRSVLEGELSELQQEVEELKTSNTKRWVEKDGLLMKNEELKKENSAVYTANQCLADEITRVVMTVIAVQARFNRTIAAVSKIFLEQKEATEEEGITETERAVIDHCLRQLTHEERAKFLCECGSLDGGFVFRNQVRREMDAVMRDPERLAAMQADGLEEQSTAKDEDENEDEENTAKTLHDVVEGPSQEVQKKEKRRSKRNRNRNRRH